MYGSRAFSIEDMKRAAIGREMSLLRDIGGIPEEVLDGRHHPCPLCGGDDRFRCIDTNLGVLLCNQCFSEKNGDFIAAIKWARGWTYGQVIAEVCKSLNLVEQDHHQSEEVDILYEVCLRKRMPQEAFEAFGAKPALRSGEQVARVPMWDEHRQQCSHFDIGLSGKLEKGLCAYGKNSGLFVATWPNPGDTVLIVEGVKDAAALMGTGCNAIGLPGKELFANFARVFTGCHVCIVPDRDIPGEEGAKKTAARLYGKAESIRIASLPGEIKEKDGDDVRDILKKKNGEDSVRQAILDAKLWVPGKGEIVDPRKESGVIREIFDGADEHLDDLAMGHQPCVSTGLSGLDFELGGGVAFGEIVLIAARPGMGKSSIGLQLGYEWTRAGIPTLMISQEMTIKAIGKRVIQYVTERQENDWRSCSDEIRAELRKFRDERQKFYCTHSVPDSETAEQVIDMMVKESGVRAVIVDYAQLLKGKGKNRFDEITATSEMLRKVTTRHNIIMVELLQLNRAIDNRESYHPTMADIKESGQFEQDADIIMFPFWPWYRNRQGDKSEFRIYIGKNRARGIKDGDVGFVWTPERQKLVTGVNESECVDF